METTEESSLLGYSSFRFDCSSRCCSFHDFVIRIRQVPAAKVLQETCNYIKSLQREVGDLSERLGELLAASDSAEADVIRRLLSQ